MLFTLASCACPPFIHRLQWNLCVWSLFILLSDLYVPLKLRYGNSSYILDTGPLLDMQHKCFLPVHNFVWCHQVFHRINVFNCYEIKPKLWIKLLLAKSQISLPMFHRGCIPYIFTSSMVVIQFFDILISGSRSQQASRVFVLVFYSYSKKLH